jgi:hypothetical protein
MVRTCQNWLGQNGTHLGLLLLLVGPNGDRFGGQAFMEHYSTIGFPVRLLTSWNTTIYTTGDGLCRVM